jgi:hypothetical protein
LGSSLISAVVLIIGSYTFLPAMVDQAVAATLQQQFGLSERPEVRLQSSPSPNVLRGNFTGGRVVISGGEFGGVETERLSIDLDAFNVDLLRSFGSGRLVSEEPVSGDLRAEISEAEVSRIAGEQITEFPVGDVELSKDRVTVGSDVEVFGLGVPISVTGPVEMLENGELEFLPEGVEAFGVPVPEEITDRLLDDSDFKFTLEDMPFEMELEEVEVEDGYLVVYGEVEDVISG